MSLAPLELGRYSGKVGDEVHAHNQGGQYVRSVPPPPPPQSTYQRPRRRAWLQLAARWRNLLTQANREAWNLYAATAKVTNRFGQEVTISGRDAFYRTNALRLQIGITTQLAPPPDPRDPQVNWPEISLFAVTATIIAVTFDSTDDWANANGGHLIIQWDPAYHPLTVHFHRSPYRYLANIPGSDAVAPSSPQPILLLTTQPSTTRGFARLRVIDADGRVSTPRHLSWDRP